MQLYLTSKSCPEDPPAGCVVVGGTIQGALRVRVVDVGVLELLIHRVGIPGNGRDYALYCHSVPLASIRSLASFNAQV